MSPRHFTSPILFVSKYYLFEYIIQNPSEQSLKSCLLLKIPSPNSNMPPKSPTSCFRILQTPKIYLGRFISDVWIGDINDTDDKILTTDIIQPGNKLATTTNTEHCFQRPQRYSVVINPRHAFKTHNTCRINQNNSLSCFYHSTTPLRSISTIQHSSSQNHITIYIRSVTTDIYPPSTLLCNISLVSGW